MTTKEQLEEVEESIKDSLEFAINGLAAIMREGDIHAKLIANTAMDQINERLRQATKVTSAS